MGKALVIRNVDFSTNKIDTVTLVDSTPCTGITLSQSTLSFTTIGATAQLTATVTPSGTTDSVVWTSSNTSVATVSSGLVECTGIGTATITATCGSYSATCTVTATNALVFAHHIGYYNHKSDVTAQDYVYHESGSASYCGLQSTTVAEKRIRYANTNYYPIIIGEGATTLTATVPDTMRITVWFTSSVTACDYSETDSNYAYLAKLISGDASAYSSAVALGNRTMTIPDGADSAVFSLQYPGGEITDEIVSGISIVAS